MSQKRFILNLSLSVFVLWNEVALEIRREDEDEQQNGTLIGVICSLTIDAAAPFTSALILTQQKLRRVGGDVLCPLNDWWSWCVTPDRDDPAADCQGRRPQSRTHSHILQFSHSISHWATVSPPLFFFSSVAINVLLSSSPHSSNM